MKRVLIIEDDQFIANICREIFQQHGFEVKLAHDGREAIKTLTSHPQDVVILDLMIPEIDGIGVLKFIRSEKSLLHLPVVVLSNSTSFSGIGQTAWETGATAFLTKAENSPQKLVMEVEKILASAQNPQASQGPKAPPPLPPRAFIKAAVGPIRVILADDDPIIHTMLGYYMEYAGYVVRSAYDGRRALAMAEEDPPDIMVLDGMMPELDGYGVLNLWHRHPTFATIPVIMLTANKDPERKQRAIGSGAVEFLPKPFKPADIIKLIYEYVGGRK